MSMRTRGQWGHPGPLGPAMSLPAKTLYLHHSVTAATNGVAAIKTVANIGIQRFGRSSYSFACTPDGTLYELQGGHVGAHTARQNSTSLAVVLVGNYENDQISNAQVTAVAWLHGDLVRRGWLAPGAPLRGHRDAPGASTACPGRTAYAALATIRARLGGSPPPQEEDDMFSEDDRELLREAVIGVRATNEPKSGHFGGRVVREILDVVRGHRKDTQGAVDDVLQLHAATPDSALRKAIRAELEALNQD